MNPFTSVIEALEHLRQDPMTIKRVKDKAASFILLLQQDPASNLDRVLRELEELGSSEIPSYDRTLLWNTLSLLEGFAAVP